MAVPSVNLTVEQGTDFSFAMRIKLDGAPLDLSGYTFSSKMKKHYGSASSYPITVESEGDGIITLSIASTVSSAIPVGRYYYDVLYDSGTTVTKAVDGMILVRGTAS
jgi:hypothetical protein